MKIALLDLNSQRLPDVDIPIHRPYPEAITYQGKVYSLSTGSQLTSKPTYQETTHYDATPSKVVQMRGGKIPVSAVGDDDDGPKAA